MRMSTKQIKKYYISIDNELERDTYETNLNVLLWKSVIQELIKALSWKKKSTIFISFSENSKK